MCRSSLERWLTVLSLQVKAVNTKGQSNYSNEITVTTKVDTIPAPEQVTYDPATRTVAFSVGPTCLALVGVAEGLSAPHHQEPKWQVVDTVQVNLLGNAPTFQEAQIEYPQVCLLILCCLRKLYSNCL